MNGRVKLKAKDATAVEEFVERLRAVLGISFSALILIRQNKIEKSQADSKSKLVFKL